MLQNNPQLVKGGVIQTEYEAIDVPLPDASSRLGFKKKLNLEEPQSDNPDFSQIVKAAYGNSQIGNMFRNINNDPTDGMALDKVMPLNEDGFNKWEAFNEMGLDDGLIQSFDAQVTTSQDLRLYQQKMKQTAEANKVLSDAGVTGTIANFIGQVTGDPTFVASLALIPFTAGGSAATAATSVARVGQTSVRLGLLGAGGAATSEAISRQVDVSETTNDDVMMVGAGALLGAVLGGAGQTWVELAGAKKLKGYTGDIKADGQKLFDALQNSKSDLKAGGSVGAMQVMRETYNFEPAGTRIGQSLARGVLDKKYIDPIMSSRNKAAFLSNQEARKTMAMISGRPSFYTKSDFEGVAAAESLPEGIDIAIKKSVKHTEDYNKILQQYAKQKGVNIVEAQETAFAMGQTLERGELVKLASGNNSDALIANAVLKQRDYMSEWNVKNLEADPDNYLTRQKYYAPSIFDRDKVIVNQSLLMDTLDGDMAPVFKEISDRYAEFYGDKAKLLEKLKADEDFYRNAVNANIKDGDKNIADFHKSFSSVEKKMMELEDMQANVEAYSRRYAFDFVQRTLGHSGDLSGYVMRGTNPIPDFFKPRSFDPLKYQKFLVTDVTHLNAAYVRKVAPKSEMTRLFGTSDKAQIVKAMRESYDVDLMAKQDEIIKAEKVGDVKLANKLKKEQAVLADERSKVVGDGGDTKNGAPSGLIEDLFALNESRYAQDFYKNVPKQVQGVMALADLGATMAYMGASVLGSFTEIASVAMHHGMIKTMPKLPTLIGKMISDPEFRAMATNHVQMSGRALSIAMNNQSVSQVLGEAGELAYNKAGKLNQWGNKQFFKYNGQIYFDHIVRTFGSLIQESVIHETLEKVARGTASDVDIREMARIGISKSKVPSFFSKINKATTDNDGLKFVDVSKLDLETARQWERLLHNDMNRTYLSGGQAGDTPVWTKHPAGRFLFKFKSWMLMAHENYTTPLLQRADAGAAAIAATTVGIGTGVAMLQSKLKGQEYSNWQSLLYDGINKSGVGGLMHIAGLDAITKQTSNLTNINTVSTKLVDTNDAASFLAGANGSFVQNIISTGWAGIEALNPIDEPVNKQGRTDWEDFGNKLSKVLPFQNHPLIAPIYNNTIETK